MRSFIQSRLPLVATAMVCLALYLGAGFAFPGFFSLRVGANFLADNGFLGAIAIGLTFVIITGGIDLSVGAMVGLTSVLLAHLIEHQHWPFGLAALGCLAFGAALGLAHGLLIAKLDLAPFLVTLAGLFLCRGLALSVSKESIQIGDKTVTALSEFHFDLPAGAMITVGSAALLILLLGASIALNKTTFGRTVFAIGGSRPSAVLMGLRVPQTLVGVYVLSGACSALGGILFTLYTSSGNAIAGTGLELDAIAVVVIGGTLLSGGYGSILGTFMGVLILGIIQTAITFQGTLSSWWTKIFIGAILLGFMLLQTFIVRSSRRRDA